MRFVYEPAAGSQARPCGRRTWQHKPHSARRAPMPELYADTLATVAAGRTALVSRLRAIAARVEALPLESVAEVLVLLEPTVAAFEREAALALERAPTYES